MDQRRIEIARLAEARKEQLRKNANLKLNREQINANVSHIIL